MPGIRTTGGPVPRSMTCISVTQRLAGLQCVLDALLGLPLANQAQESFAFQVEQVLRAKPRRVRNPASSHDHGQRASDQGVVVADAPGPPREVNAELERRQHRVTPDL